MSLETADGQQQKNKLIIRQLMYFIESEKKLIQLVNGLIYLVWNIVVQETIYKNTEKKYLKTNYNKHECLLMTEPIGNEECLYRRSIWL